MSEKENKEENKEENKPKENQINANIESTKKPDIKKGENQPAEEQPILALLQYCADTYGSYCTMDDAANLKHAVIVSENLTLLLGIFGEIKRNNELTEKMLNLIIEAKKEAEE